MVTICGCQPKNRGKNPKWMVKIMENPIKLDDLGGFPPIFGNTHVIMMVTFQLVLKTLEKKVVVGAVLRGFAIG